MNVCKIYTLLFLISVTFFGCQDKVEVTNYEVTPEFSKKINKPEVHFSVDIPNHLEFTKPEEGKKNSSYGMIKKLDAENNLLEMCSFGYIKLDGIPDIEESTISFFQQILGMLKGAGYNFEKDAIGVTTFGGKKYVTLQGIATMETGINKGYEGRFYFNSVAIPNPKGNTHIIMMMQARDDQNITSFNDFSNKLAVSTIWQSFEYK